MSRPGGHREPLVDALRGLALSFYTWRTLARDAGLDTAAAVETMIRAVDRAG